MQSQSNSSTQASQQGSPSEPKKLSQDEFVELMKTAKEPIKVLGVWNRGVQVSGPNMTDEESKAAHKKVVEMFLQEQTSK